MSSFVSLLTTDLADLRLPPEFDEFARFLGSWSLDAEFFEDDGTSTTTSAEWHFAEILGGRAIQDVLVFPALNGAPLDADHRVGTTIRFYDTVAAQWKVVWISPASGTMYKLSGGVAGDRLVLDGDPHDGKPTQWIFEDMTDDSFTWRGLIHDGDNWKLIQRMHATRRAST